MPATDAIPYLTDTCHLPYPHAWNALASALLYGEAWTPELHIVAGSYPDGTASYLITDAS